MNDALAILRLFNDKVVRLEATGLMRRFADSTPEVEAEFVEGSVSRIGPVTGEIMGRVRSRLAAFDQDEVDAFVLTYRLFTQNNDRISIGALAEIYAAEWMPDEAAERFREARVTINRYLDGASSILIGPEPISIRTILDTVIYGALAHLKPEKESAFRSWNAAGLGGFIWAEFIAAARRMSYYLGYLRDLNEAVLHNIDAEHL